jgi:hypothetical protein
MAVKPSAKIVDMKKYKKTFANFKEGNTDFNVDKKLRKKLDKITSEYRNSLGDIENLLKTGDNDEKNVVTMLKMMQAMLLSVLPDVHDACKESGGKKGVYSMVTLMTQIRELSNDLRGLEDLEAQTQKIMSNIVQPTIALVAQNIVIQMFAFKKTIDELNIKSPRRAKQLRDGVDRIIRDQGRFLSQCGLKIEKQLFEMLVEK